MSRGSKCITVPNYAAIGETVAMAIFRLLKMAAAAIQAAAMLDIEKVGILRVGRVKRVNMHHSAKFRDDWSNHC